MWPWSLTPDLKTTAMLDLVNNSHNWCPWPKDVSWPLHKVISPRSQCTHTQNLCPGHNSSLPGWVWWIFHTIVVHGQRVFHDLDARSYLNGQGHSAHILVPKNLCLGNNSSLPCWILIIFHTIVVHNPKTWHDLDARSYLQVHGHSNQHPCHIYDPYCHIGSG